MLLPGPSAVQYCTLMLFLAPPALPKAPYFTGLGHLPGGIVTHASSVADDRSVVVGWGNTYRGNVAFRWTSRTGLVSLGDLVGSSSSGASSVSARGNVVVGSSRSPNFYPSEEAFIWTAREGVRGLGSFPGGHTSTALDVSADGHTVVGGAASGSVGSVPFRWTQREGMQPLVDPGELVIGGSATAVSGDGAVIVGYLGSPWAFSSEAFVWSEEKGLRLLGDLPGGNDQSKACAVSDDGTVVVGSGYTPFGTKAAYWTEETGLVPLPDLGDGFESEALAVSADGSIIVGYAFDYYPYFYHAVIWRNLQTVEMLEAVLTEDYGLDLAGWTLASANGVSADGTTIVGFGWNPAAEHGNNEAWLVDLPKKNRDTTRR